MVQRMVWFQLSVVSAHTRNLISGNMQTHLIPHQIDLNGLINVSCIDYINTEKEDKDLLSHSIFCLSIPGHVNQTFTTLLTRHISRDVFTHWTKF